MNAVFDSLVVTTPAAAEVIVAPLAIARGSDRKIREQERTSERECRSLATIKNNASAREPNKLWI
jgi:hypothetical protein